MSDRKIADGPLYLRTPLIESAVLSRIAGCKVYLKLENLQPTASFKIRGISNHIKKAIEKGCRHLVCSSGGNAGLAAAYAARKLGTPITVYVPGSTPQFIKDRLTADEAEVVTVGTVWDHANEAALEAAKQPGTAFIAPFDHPDVWEGHTSLVEELAADLGDDTPDLVVLSVGGGGLLCGVVQGMERVGWGRVPVLCMETEGADCFNAAIQAGKLVTLPDITSVAKCLGALTVCKRAFEMYSERPLISRLVTDKQCIESTSRFADDHRMLVEPACGAAVAAVYTGLLQQLQESGQLPALKSVVVVLCGGASVTLDSLQKWKEQFKVE